MTLQLLYHSTLSQVAVANIQAYMVANIASLTNESVAREMADHANHRRTSGCSLILPLYRVPLP